MGRISVKWGKVEVELPAELLLFVLFKTFLVLHNVNV
jgi:hypothetical protein